MGMYSTNCRHRSVSVTVCLWKLQFENKVDTFLFSVSHIGLLQFTGQENNIERTDTTTHPTG